MQLLNIMEIAFVNERPLKARGSHEKGIGWIPRQSSLSSVFGVKGIVLTDGGL